ncbi:MAG: hypothetical protein NTZ16_16365, partial [Verrucomicrobia bacterium]|nr:hypothetical protein [Verrucomicrobiota bacterium]
MISIKRIKAKNVLIFDSIDVILDLNKIVVVRGDNQRSVKGDTNGVGKSVLFDLVPSVIYGITSLNIKLNEMVKNPGFVTIVFDNSGIEYEVTVSNKSGIKYQVRINGIDQEVHTIANARSILSRAWSIKESEYWSIWNLN